LSATEKVVHWGAEGRPLDVTGAATRVWVAGDGAPVVCMHGLPVSAYLYRKVLPELAARDLRGVAFDLPGLGFADRPREFDYSWSGLGRWSLDAVDALGLDRFHLVVHDIGGPIGFDLARRVPERVLSLTALNTWVRVASFKRPWFMEPYAHRVIGPLNVALSRGPAIVALMRWKGVSTPVPADELRAHSLLLHREDGGHAFLQIMRSFERTPEFEAALLGALAQRPYPAQVLWGVHDTALRADLHGEHVRAALGLDDIHRVDAKHFVPEDAPAVVAERVAALAAGREPDG
jgi:pimeloyl-ACP methyl ester carboxylesterase